MSLLIQLTNCFPDYDYFDSLSLFESLFEYLLYLTLLAHYFSVYYFAATVTAVLTFAHKLDCQISSRSIRNVANRAHLYLSFK